MLTWFSNGAQNPDEQQSSDDSCIDGVPVPPTPGPATFAFQALRYGLLGTPKPSKLAVEKTEEASGATGMDENTKVFEKKEVEKKLAPPKICEPLATPTKKGGQPQGILLTPGTALGRKKSVTFGKNNYREMSPDEIKPQRIRSGLPASYPGKFPSPWTPRVAGMGNNTTPAPSTKKSKPVSVATEDSTKPKPQAKSSRVTTAEKRETKNPDETKNEMQAFVEEQIAAVKSNTARLNELMELTASHSDQDPDVTMNLEDPRSKSGKFWKSRYDTEVEEAKAKIETYKGRRDLAVDFASKKDSQCSDLAVRLKEEMDLRRKLQCEVDRWQKEAEEAKRSSYIGDRTQQKTHERVTRVNEELREMVASRDEELLEFSMRFDEQRRELDRYRTRVYELECELEDGVAPPAAIREAPEQSNFDLMRRISQLERQLDNSKKECEQRATEEERLKTEISRLRTEQQKKASNIDELKWELSEAKKHKDEVVRKDKEIAKLNLEIGKLQSDCEGLMHSRPSPTHTQAMDDLHNKHIETVKDLRVTQERLASLRIEHNQMTAELKNPPKNFHGLPDISRVDDGVPDLGNYDDDIPSLPPISPTVQDFAYEERLPPPIESPGRRAALSDLTNKSLQLVEETKPLNKFASPRPKFIFADFNEVADESTQGKNMPIDTKRASAAARVAARKAAMKAAMREKEN